VHSLDLIAAALVLSVSFGESGQSLAGELAADARILSGRIVSITDGDTLTLLVDREQIRIRLAQIDAPESAQPYGKKSKAALSELAFGKTARVEVVAVDRYGRTVGEVYVGGLHVNSEMVRSGHAWAYTVYSRSLEIIAFEDEARAAGLGLWALPESERDPPWIWRHPHSPKTPPVDPSSFRCGQKHVCSEMTSCGEAQFYMTECGIAQLDGDRDGVPCESICGRSK
jgi:endonuclease YncB( thermonuclease family)